MSPFKILLLVVAIAALWYGFRIVSRVRAVHRHLQEQVEAARAAARANAAYSAGGGQIEELVKCSQCGEYVSEKATSCDRDGCPFRG